MNDLMDDIKKKIEDKEAAIQELAKQLEQDKDRIREEVRRQLGLGESWGKRNWWLGWVLLFFLVGCSLIWAVTR